MDYEVDPLTDNLWTDVALTVDEEGLTVSLTYDGVQKLPANTAIQFAATETLAQATVGPKTSSTTPLFGFRDDNVRISTTRDP